MEVQVATAFSGLAHLPTPAKIEAQVLHCVLCSAYMELGMTFEQVFG